MSRSRPGLVGDILRGAGARLVVLPIAAIAAIVSARIITEQYGIDSFAWYSLIVGLPLLVPFADAGLGAAVTTAGALATRSAADAVAFRAVLGKSLRIALIIGGSIAAASLVCGWLGAWTMILGITAPDLNWPIGIALASFGLAVPGGIGFAALLGLGRNALAVVVQGLTPIVTMGLVLVVVMSGGDRGILIAICCGGTLLVNWIGMLIALRCLPPVGGQPTPTLATATRIATMAVPMALLMAGGAIYLQSGRLIVSHVGSVAELAALAAVWLFFQPLWSVLQTSARAIWPRFARHRSDAGRVGASDHRAALTTMTVLGAVAGLGLVLVGPPLASLATAGQAHPHLVLFVLLGLVLLTQGAHLASGMLLTHPSGLRLQALTGWAAASVAVIAAVVAVPWLGASAVALGMLLGLVGCQFIPALVVARREVAPTHRGNVVETASTLVGSAPDDSETR